MASLVQHKQDQAPSSTSSLPETTGILPRRLPKHVAIIMDGNGRWATSRGLPRTEGHRHGTENLRRIIRASVEFGVEILTIYAFSTENWGRPRREVQLLMRILESVIDRELNELDSEGVQIRHIGRLEEVSPHLQRKIRQACEKTRHNTRLILNVAFNYGGRGEIVHAIKRIIEAGIKPEDVTEEVVSGYLYTSGLPDPELIIRTSGELRISNFLIWQGSYAEYYLTPVYWPDFDKEEYRAALLDFSKRRRRFGMTDAQLEALGDSAFADDDHDEDHDDNGHR